MIVQLLAVIVQRYSIHSPFKVMHRSLYP